MKKSFFGLLLILIFSLFISSFQKEKHCVYRTLMNEDPVELDPTLLNMESVKSAVDSGLKWLEKAQHEDGGWGCGFHAHQNERNPHAVPSDPATTAVVAMALLRSGSSLEEGPHKEQLKKATNYLLLKLENSNPNSEKMTAIENTQIQRKLGANIDLVLTTQYLSNLMYDLKDGDPMKERIEQDLSLAVDMIQLAQNADGSLKGGTWAGVLQSSFANSALESAQGAGIYIDGIKLKASRQYQKNNFDLKTEEVSTAAGAGVMLYSISSTTRASAKEAREAENKIQEAIQSGLLSKREEVSTENLIKAGIDEEEAMELNTSYQIFQAGKVRAQRDDVIRGFGNNGGEEFLSFLQTGESLVLNADDSWTNWYDNVTQRILDIQNNDGSWNGHHCITSPVFCTATCISILTIQNDIEKLKKMGEMSE